jgi:uncharacterized protein YcfJ
MISFMRLSFVCAVLCSGMLVGGCSENAPTLGGAETGALLGTALGAGVGAIVGNQSGNAGPGVAIGAAAGALGGALIGGQSDRQGHRMSEQDERIRRQEEELQRQRREIDELRRNGGYDSRGNDGQNRERDPRYDRDRYDYPSNRDPNDPRY